MKIFTSFQQHKGILPVLLFWLLAWHLLSLFIGQDILLVSPLRVLQQLKELIGEAVFWQTLAFSFRRIAAGFLLGLICGLVFAALSAGLPVFDQLISPLLATIKATPVASFIILVLIWVPARNLSVLIAFLMVLPIVYGNVQTGIRRTDPKLLEMARVFKVPLPRQVRFIYVSEVVPYVRAACASSLGLAWKAGVAAEVIGIPTGSIGERLYEAKIYLNTADLLAWTFVIILISVVFEKMFLALLDHFIVRWERM